ncbi:DEAD/DEAH box helicase [Salibacterium qingdaonense]|uniref:Competence protein ComFA n=1 Tax=Salibacterium qingdaonense TaxID=266892 RepID=A0A1I4L0K2_9BACI|nr:DEAD/DEAH box helicase [Salibacterium qingdaonense]SFL84572.1 competence protein ComFA [Salibacterium qingdaonense]
MNVIHAVVSGRPDPVCLPAPWVEESMQITAGPDVISRLPLLPSSSAPGTPLPAAYHHLQERDSGKELLFEEIDIHPDMLKSLLLTGWMQARPGLIPFKTEHQCRRCGNTNRHRFGTISCARCGRPCVYCRHCVQMGRICACSILYSWTAPPMYPRLEEPVLQWKGTLSPGQQRASGAVVQAVEEKKEILIWAVCGAGKTEVLFEGVARALELGGTVLIAAPRTDVVLELAPRLQVAFPHVALAALYGGSEDKQKPAQLVLSTTHQAMRFTEAFDTVIIDEVDAFPYSADESLVYAVRKAARPDASLIRLTATPPASLQRQVKRKQLPCVRIPRRYHGFPLPVPRFQWAASWKRLLQKGRFPAAVKNWCRGRIDSGTPAFLFVPSVSVLEQVTAILKKEEPFIEGVHSTHDNRHETVRRFREGTVPLLVTTTIMERGVTIENADVAVLGAEAAIFTESAFVQIAGRAGRSADYPDGDVVFFHAGKTEAMAAAKRHITSMNREEVQR